MSPPAPRHVLMTADTIGGVWTFAMELCAELDSRGVAVTLVTMGRLPDADQRAEAISVRGISLVATEFRLEWMADCQPDVIASGEYLLALAERLKPDLVHANTYYHAGLPFDAPVLLTAHSCVASWWRACKGAALPPEHVQYARWIASGIARAGMVVAPTQAYLDEFQKLHGSAKSARVIWNGRSRPQHRSLDKENFVLAAGRVWDEAKNIQTLCLAAQNSDLQIVVCGDEQSPDGRDSRFEGVTLLGRLANHELADWMARARIFAAPARYEPFGLSILEAARSGCALVLGDIASLRELWDGAAVFVNPNDVAGWSRTLSALTAEPERAAQAGANARDRAMHYSALRMADSYCDAYATLVPGAVRAPSGRVAA
jgi:glycosyltransferase involved in cell wall biosynthesis